ncbi:MAG: alpha-ketoacid dehydrogenase subunit beta [Cyanobacteria bacterium NC_groundwater_1444_Ag_S-0.65um_54_12]|nr:alpha-ketoacid dehydrogenase subunit beta [Cyanobacteria bacterium NC_groundwater_1444_Ag_S-0.65um_54_12]
MSCCNFLQAINITLKAAMRNDERVIVLGEDVGRLGGVFHATSGLIAEFGTERVLDMPPSAVGIIGTAIGMALYGLRPIPEVQFADFLYPAFDQIINELAKYRYRSGGQYACPVIIRAPVGGGVKGGLYHSQSPEAYFCHTAGLKVVMPANPYDAKGLLLSAIRGADPVIFLEPKRLYRAAKGEVPDEDYFIPLGEARIVRSGTSLTVISYGAMLPSCLEAADALQPSGIFPEIIDLRTLIPLDLSTLLNSVQKTGRAVIVHEAPRTSGFGAEIAALLYEHAFLYLESPIIRITGYDAPFPYALESEYLPDASRVADGIRQALAF